MKNSKMLLFALFFGVLVLIAVVLAVVKRNQVADLILRGGDLALIGEAAQNSPQAAIAVDFLGALRTRDKAAVARLATPEQVARFDRDAQQSSADSQESMMLEDLPADPAALRSKIKSVQGHKDRAVVLFETKANSWYVQLIQADGTWKVFGY